MIEGISIPSGSPAHRLPGHAAAHRRDALVKPEAVWLLESCTTQLLEAVYHRNRRWVVRALHRDEHLDEVDAALGATARPEGH